MYQVLMNLCTNAGHAMQQNGGLLAVSLANVEVDSGLIAQTLGIDPGAYLRLKVSNTGCGMAPDVMERIFDPYFI